MGGGGAGGLGFGAGGGGGGAGGLGFGELLGTKKKEAGSGTFFSIPNNGPNPFCSGSGVNVSSSQMPPHIKLLVIPI